MISIESVIEQFLQELGPKQRKVVVKRFGLQGGRKTLQEIGNELSITRERVRQIENQALKRANERMADECRNLVACASEHLVSSGGVREDELFVSEVRYLSGVDPGIKNLPAKLRFIFFAAGAPLYFRETPTTKSFWYRDEQARKNLTGFLKRMTDFFAGADRERVLLDRAYLEKIKQFPEGHFLALSKEFDFNTFGDFGPVDWSEIRPKNMRDKAYLVLHRHGQPMHFEAIARAIFDAGVHARPVNVQTVHNELIKDGRFVLVGRGMYALQAHGYKPGTVREVIADLIRTKGPLPPKVVVQLVNAQRFLKENTILLNLQNRRHFKRLENGAYDIREA